MYPLVVVNVFFDKLSMIVEEYIMGSCGLNLGVYDEAVCRLLESSTYKFN